MNRYGVPIVSAVLLVLCWLSFSAPKGYVIAQCEATGPIITPGPALAKLGVRAGDMYLYSRMPTWQRMLNAFPTWRGRLIPTIVRRSDGAVVQATVPADILRNRVDYTAFDYAVAFFSLALTAYLGYRRPSAMMLLLALGIGSELFSATGSAGWIGYIRSDWLRTLLDNIVEIAADVFAPLFLAAFVVRFPGDTPSAKKRVAIQWIDALVYLGAFVEAVYAVTRSVFPDRATYTIWYSTYVTATVLLGAVLSLRTTPSSERPRVAVVLVAIVLNAIAYGLALTAFVVTSSGWYFTWATLLVPVSVTYAILRHKLFDVAFVLNRTIVYAVTSVVVLALLAAIEFFAERYLATLTHAESVLVELGIAVVVVLSARTLHRRVDTTVDRVFFRARHEQEAALRDFARSAQFYSAAQPLLRDVSEALVRYARVRDSGVYLKKDDGLYLAAGTFSHAPAGTIDENDPLFVAMRAHQRQVQTRDFRTQFAGSVVYPMLLGGRIAGAVCLGDRETNEEMPPDINDAVVRVVESVTIALATMESERAKQQVTALQQRIDAMTDGRAATGGAAAPHGDKHSNITRSPVAESER